MNQMPTETGTPNPLQRVGSTLFDGRRLRGILAIDERENCIALAQIMIGRLVIGLVALATVSTSYDWWHAALVVGAAMASAFFPKYRNAIIFGATWVVAFLYLWLSKTFVPDYISNVMEQEYVENISPLALACGATLFFLICAWCTLWLARRDKTWFFARRPIMTLIGLAAVLCGLTSLDGVQGLSRVLLCSILIVYTRYLWFLAYAIIDQRSREASPPLFQLGVFRPFWSSSSIPIGKGAAFLRKALSKTPRDLAVTQIKGLKLLLWANILLALKLALTWFFEDHLQVPSVELAMDAFLHHQPFSIHVGWASLIWSTTKFCLKAAYGGHLFVGVARLAGFRLARNTWRPLESRTLMEYFNRFSYYFKELLVDFFFLPTFFTTFRNHPRLRMFFATFMAAGVGNAIWHFIRDIDVVATMGLAGAFETYTSYAFYCLILATGVGVSQVRASMGVKPSATFFGRLHSFLFVWSFVVCLHVFSDESRNHTLGERLSFLASLFGVS
ncbi:conserved membrane hypothetical protein [Candidatus Accumulibacter aalborgensis]|uniref:Membrane bound O-acyl transferase MBOAT family protein n=1 Tax=Candidatus Accumulibacter aalborgensis TaxID=1860102 RepID=A0A1A8XR61_9PROT|nr:hypothetical protein [Candidatus Accumulibacter aalborgensis]SBT06453.1 conserved membrane hypothetical protein [Candidatus Accumulibacter aalborgensis]